MKKKPSWKNRRRMMWTTCVFIMVGCMYGIHTDTVAAQSFITVGLPSLAGMVAAYCGFAAHEDIQLHSTGEDWQ